MMYDGPNSGDLAFSATMDLEKRLKLVEDRLGITEERHKEQRAAWFRKKRELVVKRREARAAGVTLHQYLQYQHLTKILKIPDVVLNAYENERGKQ